jgi:hypothetical protein
MGKTLSLPLPDLWKDVLSTTATPYHRLQHRRATFDEVATLSVEGLNKSAIARVKRVAWNTVHRWLERAAGWCRRFSDRNITRFAAVELQADEIRTIVGNKQQSVWVFVLIDVGSRLWPSTVVGKRSYHDTTGPVSRRFEPDDSQTSSFDCHRRIRILRESRGTNLWASMSTVR